MLFYPLGLTRALLTNSLRFKTSKVKWPKQMRQLVRSRRFPRGSILGCSCNSSTQKLSGCFSLLWLFSKTSSKPEGLHRVRNGFSANHMDYGKHSTAGNCCLPSWEYCINLTLPLGILVSIPLPSLQVGITQVQSQACPHGSEISQRPTRTFSIPGISWHPLSRNSPELLRSSPG